MGTRSTVKLFKKNKFKGGIYIQFDGYIEGVGKELLKNFSTLDKVKKLINGGSIDSIFRPASSDNKRDVICDEFLKEAFNYEFRDGNWFVDGVLLKNLFKGA